MSIIATFIVPHPPLVIPGIGSGEKELVHDTINAYHTIAKEIAKIKPDTIILSSPHAKLYQDYFHISPKSKGIGNFSQFGAPSISFNVDYDESLVNEISKKAEQVGIPAGTFGGIDLALDHGTMVPLFFINQYYEAYKLVRISPSGLSSSKHYQFGKLIQSVIPNDKKVVWVASGDLSHKLKKDGPYGLSKEGPIFDKKLTDAIAIGDFGKLLSFDSRFTRKAAECGLTSFIMMAGSIDGLQIEPNLLSYEGPFGVGYAVAMFKVIKQDKKEFNNDSSIKQNENQYIKLARESLNYYYKHNKRMSRPKNISGDAVNNKAGVFVSLYKNNILRGCVGTLQASTNCVADEIIQNVIRAAESDPRFPKVKQKELDFLQYKIDVLQKSEPIDSIDELDIIKYGVIVYNGYKTGLLLPNIEGIDSIEEQVSIAKRKAGLSENEPYRLKRFEVIRYK